jgi:signal transduction histidine kinase
MGSDSLETRLNVRVGAVVASVLALLALVGVGATALALRSIDEDKARTAATGFAATMHAELGDGDTPAVAATEVVRAAPGNELVRIRMHGAMWGQLPPALVDVGVDSCRADEGAHAAWLACTVASGPVEATAAIRTDGHRAVVRRLAQAMIVAVALALMGAYLAMRFALRRPLRALDALVTWSDGVQRRGRGPSSLVAAPRGGARELDRLALAFDALLRDLLGALDRERATLAYLAHELRTPLTAMRIELEAAAPASPLAARLAADTVRLARVVDAVLLLANPERDERADANVNLADLARELAPAGAVVVAPDEAVVRAQPDLVALALTNLLENATRHARGVRTVLVTREGECARVAVRDLGDGVDEATRTRMFDRHWRASRDRPGWGLGLALVRAVAERHGGAADARTATEGGLDVGFSLGPVLLWHDAKPDDVDAGA